MGRKPHRVVQEYFARGAKLEDSSNRYQHTCKSCGERFPKGRIDSLLSHLLRKCPGISNEHRQRVLQELVEKPSHNGSYNQLAVTIRNEQLGDDPGVQYDNGNNNNNNSSQSMSALETLAEVSRQQLDTTDGGDQQAPSETPANRKKRKRRRATDAQQRLQTTFAIRNEQFDPQLLAMPAPPPPPPPAQDDQSSNAHDNDLFPGIDQYATADLSGVAPTARMVPDQLALTASAANQMMPSSDALVDPVTAHNSIMVNSTTTNTELNGDHTDVPPTDSIDPQLQQDADAAESSPPPQFPLDKSLLLGPRTVPSNPDMPHVHFFNNFLLGDGPNRRVRGRFSDVRRKEVQEVRKQGACIRCRMLKKPCSGGTPCTTCKNVETARLWKIPCLRARIADEFDLYSSGVQTIIMFQETNDAKNSVNFQASPKEIEATIIPEDDDSTSNITLRFKSICTPSKQDASLSTLNFLNDDDDDPPGSELELVDTENQDIVEKLGQYFQIVNRSMFAQESSKFMRQTLEIAADLVTRKMDPLLSRALDLWVATDVLANPNAAWTFYSSPLGDNASGRGGSGANGQREISPTLRSSNHRLLTQQLRAFTEKLSAQLAKVLINDLEKRLLQRQQTSAQHFETFVTAIILLNCIERMCWLFNSWATKFEPSDLSDPGVNGQPALSAQQVQPHDRGVWPLVDRHPQAFLEKGISIANLIAMLLKMRGIPPATTVGNDGTLRLSPHSSSGGRKANTHNKKHQEDHNTSNDELVAHLAQAAAAAASGSTDEPTNGIEDLMPKLPPSMQETTEPATVTAAQPNEERDKQGMASAAQNSLAAAWLDKVNVTEEQLRLAQAAESFDEDDYRCWDLRFVARLLLPEE